MRALLNDKNFRIAFALSAVLLGFATLLFVFELIEYGIVLFVVLPIALGIQIGLGRNLRFGIFGSMAALIIFGIVIVAFTIEALLCVLLCIPLFVVAALVVALVVNRLMRNRNKNGTRMHIVLIPLFVFIAAVPVEHIVGYNDAEESEVRSVIELPYTPLQVYDAIKSVDTLNAELSPLMHLGLPVPQKCVLEKEEPGAMRVCYFEGGTIEERITQLTPGKVLAMDVTSYNLMGLHWLGFRKAIYTFDATSTGCRLTRITTYTSSLRPRLYWQYPETLGIQQEHEYVFRNLQKDLQRIYGK